MTSGRPALVASTGPAGGIVFTGAAFRAQTVPQRETRGVCVCVRACARACRMEVKESFLEEVMSKRSLLGAGQVKKSEQHSKPSRPPMHLCEGQEHWEAESI